MMKTENDDSEDDDLEDELENDDDGQGDNLISNKFLMYIILESH